MRMPLFACPVLALGLLAVPARADPNPEIVPLGHDTYALTRWAENGFVRNTEKLKAQALEDVAAYCAKLHKQPKIISTEASHPVVPLTGFAHAKIVFKALDADDPELRAPLPAAGAEMALGAPAPAAAPPAAAESALPRTATDQLYNDLMKLDDLRKRGILTDEEFQAQKKKLLDKSN
ncbi:MAG TPA: SHOCT domain-containing protein [Opitutaceae bacterium]|nr:SHOCT domain-containing protein [Opitutaceae bacterium]